MKTLYISDRDTDGMPGEVELWARKYHPELRVCRERDGVATVVMDDDGNIDSSYDVWDDFCNADHDSY